MIPTKKDLERHMKELMNSDNEYLKSIYLKFKDQPDILNSLIGDVIEQMYEEMNPFKWQPVPTIQFLNDPYYCGRNDLTGTGVAATMYPKLKDDFCNVHDINFPMRECIITGAIGIGKSFFMSLGLAWHLYFLSCLKNPQKFLKLSSNSKITLMIISITEKQAKTNMFGNVKEMIKGIPYFTDNFMFDPKKATDSLLFPNNVELFAGTSTQSSTIGLNIWAAALDEANFFKVIQQSKRSKDSSGEYDEAMTMYYSLLRRQESRYLKAGTKPGVLYLGSSKQYPNDFTTKRITSATETQSKTTYVMDYSLWAVAPEKYSKETFMIELGGLNKRNRILTGSETDVTGEIIHVPMDFYDGFKKDLDNAIRDLAGIALYSISPFFGEREKIHEMFDESLPRIFSVDRATLSDDPKYSMVEKIEQHQIVSKEKARYVAMDIGLKHDKFGFAMGYIEKVDYVATESIDEMSGDKIIIKEKRPFVVVEMALTVYPDKELGEVELSRVRALIYKLKKYGYKIRRASADGFQSADMQQILKRNGIVFDYISMDRTTEPYETFRSAIYEGRVRSVYHPLLEDEMIRLEKNYVDDKVDHPVHGSKDLCDAVGQLVHNCHINMIHHDDSLLPTHSEASETKSEASYEEIIEDFKQWAMGMKKERP